MCTVSVIRVGPASLRLVSNRDEAVTRPPAFAPEWRTRDDRRALWPTDPHGGGTWIAVNDRGLALAILNLNLEPSPTLPAGLASRGGIIPALAHAATWRDAVDQANDLDLGVYAPFRLLVTQARADVLAGSILRWDRSRLSNEPFDTTRLCLVSSGLGDSLVAPRLGLFDELVPPGAETPAAQDAFHAHAWPGRGPISVMMSREGARTHSVTSVQVDAAGASPRVAMDHRPVAWAREPAHF